MKIFQVVPYYPPHVGGMEYYVQRLSEELSARGHEVTVFTSSMTEQQLISTHKGVKICSLKIMRKIYNVPVVPNIFTRLLEEEAPDIIHTHQYPVFFSDMAAAASCLKKVPLIIHVHVISDAKSTLSGFISDMYYSTVGLRTLQTADSIIVPSFAYKDKLAKMHVNTAKIQVIPYGIDISKFENDKNGEVFKTKYNCQGAKIILSVGRLNYQKGFQYLIRAMPAIIQKIPEAKLIIVGEGEQRQYLQQLAKRLGVSERVIFTGALNQTQIPAAYAACDVFVLSSLFESFGISLIEAQAAGKPVVSTRTGGAPEALLNGKTGFLVEPANHDQLVKSITILLKDKTLALTFGENGKLYTRRRFGIQLTVEQVLSAYNSCNSS